MSSQKLAIVTGANKGLGYAIVKQLCEKFNGVVYLTSRDEAKGHKACKELEKLGLSPCFHQLDISDEISIVRFSLYVRAKYGKVDVLINNAGIFLKHSKRPHLEKVKETLNVNFFSLVNFCEKFVPLIRDGGKIVNISSSSGHLSRIPGQDLKKIFQKSDLSVEELVSLMHCYVKAAAEGVDMQLGWGDSPYVVSKVGVNAYTFILHRMLSGKQISVNCIHPGYVRSDMTGGSGNITTDEGANTPVLFALEDHGSGQFVWHNGAVVPWDGPDPREYIDGISMAKS